MLDSLSESARQVAASPSLPLGPVQHAAPHRYDQIRCEVNAEQSRLVHSRPEIGMEDPDVADASSIMP